MTAGTQDQATAPASPETALLAYEPQSARRARHLVRDKLADWDLDVLAEASELVVTELVANAVATGCQTRMLVTIRRTAEDAVRICVRDGSRTLPVVVDADPYDETGRGMHLVVALTGGAWGAQLDSCGKTVFADLSVRRSAKP